VYLLTRRLADDLGAVAVPIEQFAANWSSALAKRRFGPGRLLLEDQQLDLSFDDLELSD